MTDSSHPENCNTPQRRFPRSYSKAAILSMMLIICQHAFISPLDKGQQFTQLFFQKPIDTIITIPQDLRTGELEAKTTQKLPAAAPVWLTKKERLFHPIIIKVANEHEMDPALIKAIIMAESGYNPKAISKRGAVGLMQLMPETAESLGVEDVFNPEHNISGGVIYFKRLVALFEGDLKLALAAYNAGSRKVKMYQGIPPFKATRFYIEKVFKYYEYYRRQMTTGLKQA